MPRLLLVKLGAIGDVVMAIPGAYAMHRAGYEVDWVCGETVAPLLQLYSWINVIPVDEKKLLQRGHLETFRQLVPLWRKLRGRKYEVCATLYYDSRYKLLSLAVRSTRKLLLSRTERATQLLPGRHHTDEYARILLGRKDDETSTQLAPVRAVNLPANPLPQSSGKPRVVLVPGGARNALRDDVLRRWPIESYVVLAGALLQAGCEVVLSGGPDDAWTSPHFIGLAVTNLSGKLSLLESTALLDSAAIVITHDTGPLHLAGVTHAAIIGIFGPTDPRGRLPQRSNAVALWGGEGFACRPCYDGRDYAPCHNNGCIQQILPAMVVAEVNTLLAAIREGKPLLPRVRTPKHTPTADLVRLV